MLTIKDRAELILNDVISETSVNPVTIFNNIASKSYINMHGPEHHILDGASILVAFKNAGGNINLEDALPKLMNEGLRMPGAMCGLWGICGAITSIGAAIAIIDGTGPLSTDGSWGDHMAFTAAASSELGRINGPRCCKRDALIAIKNAVTYINNRFNVKLEYEPVDCKYSGLNNQCIKSRCHFYTIVN